MKLVEILARGIVEWKEGWFVLDQSNVDGEIYAYNKEDVLFATGIFLDKAEDADNYVYRDQWQAERDRMKAMETQQATASTEPTYEQQLWDRVAQSTMASMLGAIGGADFFIDDSCTKKAVSSADFASCAADHADAFMAERAKRVNNKS